MNYNEQIREGKGFLTKIKKIAPISLITGLDKKNFLQKGIK